MEIIISVPSCSWNLLCCLYLLNYITSRISNEKASFYSPTPQRQNAVVKIRENPVEEKRLVNIIEAQLWSAVKPMNAMRSSVG